MIAPNDIVVAALLQATSLPFIVAASMIGLELGQLDQATGAALIAAGLLSVLAFPLLALTLLRRGEMTTTHRQTRRPNRYWKADMERHDVIIVGGGPEGRWR